MKKKYIVGDLVRYTSLCKEPVAEICEVCETSYLIRFMNGNFARVTNEEIKPLPLTTKILEKNGWKKSKINDCAYFYYKYGVFLTYTSKDGKFWFDDFDNTLKPSSFIIIKVVVYRKVFYFIKKFFFIFLTFLFVKKLFAVFCDINGLLNCLFFHIIIYYLFMPEGG